MLTAPSEPHPPPAALSRDFFPPRPDSTYSTSPSSIYPTQSTSSRVVQLSVAEPGEEIDGENEQGGSSLPPVDGGYHAWAYVLAAFILETTIWGVRPSFCLIRKTRSSHRCLPFHLRFLVFVFFRDCTRIPRVSRPVAVVVDRDAVGNWNDAAGTSVFVVFLFSLPCCR